MYPFVSPVNSNVVVTPLKEIFSNFLSKASAIDSAIEVFPVPAGPAKHNITGIFSLVFFIKKRIAKFSRIVSFILSIPKCLSFKILLTSPILIFFSLRCLFQSRRLMNSRHLSIFLKPASSKFSSSEQNSKYSFILALLLSLVSNFLISSNLNSDLFSSNSSLFFKSSLAIFPPIFLNYEFIFTT